MNLSEVNIETNKELPITDGMFWFKLLIRRLVCGGIYLISGEPGSGKSTVTIQLGLDMAIQGIPVLFIMTEQHSTDLATRARQITEGISDSVINNTFKKIKILDMVTGLNNLCNILSVDILNPSGRFHGVKLVILDSVQGQGLPSTSTAAYEVLYRFGRQLKLSGITLVLIAHMTKNGKIGGPRTLEHNVDCTLLLRRAPSCSAAIVLKNRYAEVDQNYLALNWNKNSALQISPHATLAMSEVFGCTLNGIVEIQLSIGLSQYGRPGKIISMGVPEKELEQILSIINQLPGISLQPTDFIIHCRIPSNKGYSDFLGLSLAIGLISAYTRRPVPLNSVFIGEVDLRKRCRISNPDVTSTLIESMANMPELTIFCPNAMATEIHNSISASMVVIIETLEEAINLIWPETL
jgi:DNA repair protein RadA/Sms